MSATLDFDRIRRTIEGMESLTDDQIRGILSVAQEAEAEEKTARKQATENALPAMAAVADAIASPVFHRVSKAGNPGWSLSATLPDGRWVSINVNAPKKK
jgi:hypothetical protein